MNIMTLRDARHRAGPLGIANADMLAAILDREIALRERLEAEGLPIDRLIQCATASADVPARNVARFCVPDAIAALSAVKQAMTGSGIHAMDRATGDDLHAKWTAGWIVRSFRAAAAPEITARAHELGSLFLPGGIAEQFDAANKGDSTASTRPTTASPPLEGARLLFEEIGKDDSPALLTRHLLLTCLRLLCSDNFGMKAETTNWDTVRIAVGYQRLSSGNPLGVALFDRADSRAFNVLSTANQVVASTSGSDDKRRLQVWAVALWQQLRKDSGVIRDLGGTSVSVERIQAFVDGNPEVVASVERGSRGDPEVEAEPHSRFMRSLWREAGVSNSRIVTVPIAVVTALVSLPAMSTRLESITLSRLRKAFGYDATGSAPGYPNEMVAEVQLSIDCARSAMLFLWWPGMAQIDLHADFAAVVLWRHVRTPAVEAALRDAGVDRALIQDIVRSTTSGDLDILRW
jgi:hypothetical protein